ncbi:hypothetical protein FACS189462_1160 [Spirochaetia bacterium]|nr:hypothetical protein FACS189462_1160 [Spirochaetia bacterium]
MYYIKGDIEKAIADYTKALKLDPNNVNAKENLKFARKVRGY